MAQSTDEAAATRLAPQPTRENAGKRVNDVWLPNLLSSVRKTGALVRIHTNMVGVSRNSYAFRF
jgi:hypothetical protein